MRALNRKLKMMGRFESGFSRGLTLAALALALTGCGGGGDGVGANSDVSDVTTSAVDVATLSSADAATLVVPFVSNLSELVTEQDLNSPVAAPLADASVTSKTYTPAQIRTAYQLPALPTSWSNLTAAQAAKYGAGQTIYIVDAMHDPNIVAELNAFSVAFGLPVCTSSVLSATASLPLASPDASKTCELVVAYSNGSAITNTPPAYDAGWATEIALDVQWAHATAPLARIVLIEAPSASVNHLLGAVNLANAMGPGVVSMSFGADEGSWMTSVDSAFNAANMTYLAATGDSGKGVSWPSASARVLAVGGTSLSGFTSTTRNEVAWSSTGGGISRFISAPSYQVATVPGLGAQTYRNVADVAFNADPSTGQYTALIPQGSSTIKWYSVGGTSLATPQWAGIVAVANAIRDQSGQGPLGLVQNFLYQTASSASNFFSTIFNDIVSGNNGYAASAYYDIPTGLGSPNVSNFITLASGGATAPVVSPITVSGTVGSAIAFSVAYTSPDPVTWALGGAPQGMSISSAGLISWPAPVAGTYAVTVKATDTVTALSGSATATIVVTQSPNPIIESATLNGQKDKPLSYQITAKSANPVAFGLSGTVPAGLVISPAGLLTWSQPVVGSYAFKVSATDTKTSALGSGDITSKITAASTPNGPTINASPILTGKTRRSFTAVVGISDPDAKYVSVNLKGAPAGMSLFSVGQGVMLAWARPVAGTYTLVMTAKDNNNLSAQATMLLTVY